jgi:hypothetical protein
MPTEVAAGLAAASNLSAIDRTQATEQWRRLAMSAALPNTKLFEELDYRENDGLEISLLWNRRDNTVSVFVCDIHSNDCFEVPVLSGRTRDVFEHPYAYAAQA